MRKGGLTPAGYTKSDSSLNSLSCISSLGGLLTMKKRRTQVFQSVQISCSFSLLKQWVVASEDQVSHINLGIVESWITRGKGVASIREVHKYVRTSAHDSAVAAGAGSRMNHQSRPLAGIPGSRFGVSARPTKPFITPGRELVSDCSGKAKTPLNDWPLHLVE